MKKYVALFIAVIMVFVTESLPVAACYDSPSNPNCQVPSYYHNIVISQGDQADETFHPSTLIPGRIQMYLDLTGVTARYVFNESSNSNLRYNNYLWGEYDTSIGTHEGVDMRRSDERAIRTSLAGEVIYPTASTVTNTYGKVCIYNSTYNITLIFMHMKDIPSTIGGTNVAIGTFIGEQSNVGTSGSHLHIQVEPGRKSGASSGNENNLTSTIPYGYMSNDVI